MDRLTELLAAEVDLDSLTDEELATRRQDLADAARAAREDGLSREGNALLQSAAAQVTEIRTLEAARAEEAAEIIAEADAALAAMGDDDESTDDDTSDADETETEQAPAEEPAPETAAPEAAAPAAVEEAAPVAIAAAQATRPVVRNVKVPGRARPRTARQGGPVKMKLSGEVNGMTVGHEFANLDEMNEAIFNKSWSMRKSRGGTPHTVATFDYSDIYPEERRIGGGDPFEVGNKIMAYLADRNEQLRNRAAAMAASGGVPGPSEPNYNVITFGQADRPLRDGLPSILMKRGATVYNVSPVLPAVVLDTSAGAIGTVTNAQDVSGVTKDVQEVPAPVAKTVTVEAETMRWSQGNFADRFLPEWTAAFMKLGQVAFARHNEALRLADIKANCTQYTDTPAKFGAYRDLKRAVLGELEELEDLIRDFSQPMCLILPEFVPAMLATDLIAQQPGDASWSITEEAVRRDVESWYPALNVIWAKDSIRGRLSTTPSGQSPRSPGFDADVEWALFPEGAFVYGDGGQLDLGILRDTVVSATNKFQTFYEGWEALLPMVDKSICFWNTSSLCANGASQLASAVNVCSPQGS